MPIEKKQERLHGADGAAAADIRDRAAAILTFTDEEEALLGKGLGAILMPNGDLERQKALAFESTRRNPDAALAAMNANARGSFSEKPWAVELYRLAAEATTRPDAIFLAFPWIEKKEGAIEVLEAMAQKHPVAAVKNLGTYYDHPKAETIFKAAMAAGPEAQSVGRGIISSWGSDRQDTIKKYPWMQVIYIDVLLSQEKAAAVIQEAKKFGGLPWFQPAIDALPGLIKTRRDLDWAIWQVTDTDIRKSFPRDVAEAIKAKLDTIKL